MKVYTYVIVTDRGSAPNYDGTCVTLAICKPRIRLGAEVGDLILAFSGKSLNPEPHSVCWAGVVKEKLGFDRYWDDPRFASKRPPKAFEIGDNIYRPKRGTIEQVSNASHDAGNAATDLSGKFVLCFDPSWVFRAAAPVLPERFGLRMTGSRRGHRVREIDPEAWKELRAWLNESRPATGSANPHQAQSCTSNTHGAAVGKAAPKRRGSC